MSDNDLLAPSDHTITLPDGSTQTYHLRSLRSTTTSEKEADVDIANWTKFCASVFSYKPNPPPPSYFARHFYNDPQRDADLVRVLIHCPTNNDEEREHGEIVSSVRIFRRTLTAGSSGVVEAGGIGEVCTSPNHQRRGLSKILLKDALRIMSESSSSMTCSLLHANPEFRPVYSKVGGYQSLRSEWTVVPIQLNPLTNAKSGDNNEWCIRQANFPEDANQLHKLHMAYSENRLVTIQRSLQYWREYVGAELGETLWVLTKPQPENGDEEKKGDVVAWISIRPRGAGRFQLREFGVDKTMTSQNNKSVLTSWAMERLLGVALNQVGGFNNDDATSLVLPTFVLTEMKKEETASGIDMSFLDLGNAKEENDDGWMYVNFNDAKPNVLELTTREIDPRPHLIWPTDSF